MSESFEFFGESKLLSRLTRGLQRHPKEVILLVGSPLSAPMAPGLAGVPNVAGMIDMIRGEFVDDVEENNDFEIVIAKAASKSYQAAFNFLQATRGPSVANQIVREAVLKSFNRALSSIPQDDDALQRLEFDEQSWHLNSGTESIGKLITQYPKVFGKALLTTNFDPLIEVAILRAGGELFRTALHLDGSLQQTYGRGCHTIHLHGYWWGTDTLHTTRQLVQERPRLKASLKNLLNDKLVLVCGYGGWDDVFTSTLLEIVQDDASNTEVLWTFFDDAPVVSSTLGEHLSVGLNRGRVLLYSGINGNSFFPKLHAAWSELDAPQPKTLSVPNPMKVSAQEIEQIERPKAESEVLEGDVEDRPPLIDLCLGREAELESLGNTAATAIFVTGIGGQGKSTITAKYFSTAQTSGKFDYVVWRDCKEEGERFENQIASIIELLSGRTLRGSDLAKQDIKSLIEILLRLLEKGVKALFVFDNVDHYVNLDNGVLTGSADLFVNAILNSSVSCQFLFTCRPIVEYLEPEGKARSIRLEGIDLPATKDLFALRGSKAGPNEIAEAHELTNGHAFWLDLLAHQTLRQRENKSLADLVEEIRGDKAPLPEATLASIWNKLADREHIVLRAMAETVQPETAIELGDYLSTQLNYNKFDKALRALRALNLVVVKRSKTGDDLLELHPLVRRFVRARFTQIERVPIINSIVRVYLRLMGIYKPQLQARPSLSILQRWTQAAELDIEAGDYKRATLFLAEVATTFEASPFFREYVRVVRLLLASFDWPNENRNIPSFDKVFDSHISSLSYLGEFGEVDNLLSKFETNLERDARYILFCELQCTSKWIRGDFGEALAWGRRGKEILSATNVDTGSNIEHSLALAERDAGLSDLALSYFLRGSTVESVIDPSFIDENRGGGPYYGNIGRCLHLAGQIDDALVCYQKSALSIEKDLQSEHVLNQGYIRLWIGELLLARKETELGIVFIQAAKAKWDKVSPHRARQVEKMQEGLAANATGSVELSTLDIEKLCRDWIFGKTLISSDIAKYRVPEK